MESDPGWNRNGALCLISDGLSHFLRVPGRETGASTELTETAWPERVSALLTRDANSTREQAAVGLSHFACFCLSFVSLLAKLEVTETKHSRRKTEKKSGKTQENHGGGPAWPGSHLSDGGAELALEHLLQGLELVSGDVARLLQLLQQLDGSGNIWKEAEDREGKGQCQRRTTSVLQPGGHDGRVLHFYKKEEGSRRRFRSVYARLGSGSL